MATCKLLNGRQLRFSRSVRQTRLYSVSTLATRSAGLAPVARRAHICHGQYGCYRYVPSHR